MSRASRSGTPIRGILVEESEYRIRGQASAGDLTMRKFVGAMTICGLFLAACSGAAPTGAPGAPSASGGAATGEIKLGTVLPITGAFSASGTYFQQGYQMAIDEVNAAGGVDVGGKKMQVTLT